MRAGIRGVVVVCLVAVSFGVFAASREREPRGGGEIAKRIVKKIRSLGDGLTIPGVNPAPAKP